ncbi:hypothetical protein EVAR_62673_1 [Eumeta japonica]|uniref:Uncharacterized protein n=1 Tax=Eumeta variegata TaxID=151549 RepID=A0A4C1Z532_EUMVA|nr:hypothetical protein EVAR_62673_1 [Eumeta japonica]
MAEENENGINAVEMQSMRYICGVSLKDKCRNSDVTQGCGLKINVVTKVERVVAISSSVKTFLADPAATRMRPP